MAQPYLEEILYFQKSSIKFSSSHSPNSFINILLDKSNQNYFYFAYKTNLSPSSSGLAQEDSKITHTKSNKNIYFGCTKARIPFTNKEISIQKLDFDRSVCMAAITYSSPIWKISLDIVGLQNFSDISKTPH